MFVPAKRLFIVVNVVFVVFHPQQATRERARWQGSFRSCGEVPLVGAVGGWPVGSPGARPPPLRRAGIRQGSGTYIAASPGMVEDPLGFTFIGNKQKLINDLLEVRFLLEPSIAAMAATHADENDIKKITALCDEVELLLKNHENHIYKDIELHTAIAMSSKNVVVPRLIPVINSSIPLFVETTGGSLHEETIETHREISDAIASHDPLRAQDAMYLHLVYNRKRIQLSQKFQVERT